MKKKHFIYHGKYSNTYRIATAEDAETISALLSEGWRQTTLAEVKALRKREHGFVTTKNAIAYIDVSGALVIVEPD